jgi:lipoprotein-anchoring transpeptidase ErfK/SrfK
MNTRSISRHVLSLLVAAAFVAPTIPMMSPAVAVAGTVPTGNITVTTSGLTFKAPYSSLIASCSAETTDSVVVTSSVTAWVNKIGGKADRKMTKHSLKLNKKKRRLDFKHALIGYKLDRVKAQEQIIAALRIKLDTGVSKSVALTTAITRPKKVKTYKTILVSLKQRKIYLYATTEKTSKVEKTYRCAIGMRAFPTPQGTFYIGKKVKNPSWHNGGASWAKNMPDYIGPGPSNPLGTRALYVYKKHHGDTGVRFHGTKNDASIGHAASHGCMRMHRKDVENFFPRVPVGTTVYIIN